MSSSHRDDEHRSDSSQPRLSSRSGNAYSLSHVPTQKENASAQDGPPVRRAKSHHPSKAEASQSRPTRPTREMTRGPTRMHTARTAFTRQKTNLSRQQTGLSRTQSRQTQDSQGRYQPQSSQDAEVDPEYYEYNPWYGQAPEEPIFGLNKPLPHTVRPGMRRRKYVLEEAEEEEDETEAAHAGGFEPGIGPDLEKGQGHGFTREAEEKERGRHSKSFEKKKSHKSRSRSKDYFDQTPDRSRSAHEVDVPVFPPGEEPGEKEDIPSVFPGQTGLWQSSRSRPEESERQPSEVKRAREKSSLSAREDHGAEKSQPRRNVTEQTSEVTSDASHSSITQIGISPGDGEPGYETEDSEVSEQEQEPMEPYEAQANYDDRRNKWAKFRAKKGRYWAEFWATALSVCLGLCVNLSVAVSKNQTNKFGSYETQCWGWGFAFMMGIYLAGGISGAHLNPVITAVFTIFRGSPFWRGIGYIFSQLLGGLAGGGIAYLVFQDALNAVDPTHDPKLTGTAFYPGPQSAIPMTTASAFFSESVATMILIMVLLALGDDQNAPPGAGLAPLVIAFVIATIMMCFGYNTGPTLNPARDLGPRLIAYFRGYSENPFASGYWAWGAWGATMAGGITGALIYDIFFFAGGESPINYPWIPLRHRGMLIAAWWRRWRSDAAGGWCGFRRSIADKWHPQKAHECRCGGHCQKTEHEVKHGLEKTQGFIKREKRKAKAKAQKGTRKITGGFTER